MKGHFLVWGNKDFIATVSVLDLVNEEEKQKLIGIVQTIKKLVDQFGGRWEGTASELVEASKYFKGLQIYDDSRLVGKKVREFAKRLAEWDFIEFHDGDGSRRDGRKLLFVSQNPFIMSPMSPTSPMSPGDMNDSDGDMK